MITKIGLAIYDSSLYSDLVDHFSKHSDRYDLPVKLRSGKDCMAKLEETKLDILIIEAVLPNVNGTEIARTFYFRNNLKDSPGIILISSIQAFDVFLEHMDMGRISYLLKPVNVEFLDREIDRIQSYRLGDFSESERILIHSIENSSDKTSKYAYTEKLVTNILNDFGINQRYKGAIYLRHAILLSVFEIGRYDYLLKEIIIDLSGRYNRPIGSISSLISKTVSMAKFKNRKFSKLIFNGYDLNKNMTPKEFIFRISDFVRLSINN
ncbi:MAG: response regulator [Clostridiales bacterium]|nr:response regulator [Clostridiales bacterium]